MDHPSHPFPYFGLLVTLDLDAIKAAVEAKFKIEWPFNNADKPRLDKFYANAKLISSRDPKDLKQGNNFQVDRQKVEAIVDRCIQEVEELFVGHVAWDNTIHQSEIDKIVNTAKKAFHVDPSVTNARVAVWMTQKGVKKRGTRVVMTPPPNPVANLTAESQVGKVVLRWQLPAQRCDRVLVTRNETGRPQPSDRLGPEFVNTEWIDDKAEPGRFYYYGIYSILGSEAPVVSQTVECMAHATVDDLRAQVQGTTVALTWQLPPRVKRVFVYRSKMPLVNLVNKQGQLVPPSTATQLTDLGAEQAYNDAGVQAGESWHYAVVARHDLKCHSVSESRQVTINPPPPAPNPVNPQVAVGRVLLTWAGVRGVTNPRYRVERAETPDQHDAAANPVTLTPRGIMLEDRSAVPGISYWYFVYTLADGMESSPTRVGPIVAMAEIDKLKPQPFPWRVELTWEMPRHARRVQIYRCEGEPPMVPTSGSPPEPHVTLLTTHDRDRLKDEGLSNDRTYGYRVCCVFVGPDGKDQLTPGVTVQARPVSLPAFPLEGEAQGSKAVLQWQPPFPAERFLVLRGAQAISQVVTPDGSYTLPPHVKELQELAGSKAAFEDEKIVLGQSYWYVVLARHAGGHFSPSECKRITFGEPPPTPLDFKANVVPGHIYLSWAPVQASTPVSYRLVRSETADATDANARRWTLKKTTVEDTNLVPGQSYWYFVFAIADKVTSLQPATFGPVLATLEVSDLRPHPADAQVKLTWTEPPGVKRIEIRRAVGAVPSPPGAPAGSGPAATLLTPTASGVLLDTGLTNRTAYGYHVSCIFQQVDGGETTTRGEAVLATPCGLPAMVTHIKGEFTTNRAFKISWRNPHQEGIEVYTMAEMSPMAIGETMPVTDLDTLGQRLGQVTASEAIDPRPSAKHFYYLVFTQNRMIAVLSAKIAILELFTVKAASKGNRVQFEWVWPDRCSGIQITQTRDDKRVVLATVQRADYPDGNFTLSTREENLEQVFRVRCLSADPAVFVPGPGRPVKVKPSKKMQVQWKLTPAGWFRSGMLEIQADGDLTELQRLVLVGKVGAYPDSIDDGWCVREWPAEEDGDVEGPVHQLSLPVKPRKGEVGQLICKLFIDPKEAARIIQPRVDEAVLK